MTREEIQSRLNALIGPDGISALELHQFSLELETSGAGLEAVEPILLVFEANPSEDFGSPGAMVHFVESIGGYEKLLEASLSRQPTPHTVWMLNRVINGTQDAKERGRWIQQLAEIHTHPLVDDATRDAAEFFLEFQERGGLFHRE